MRELDQNGRAHPDESEDDDNGLEHCFRGRGFDHVFEGGESFYIGLQHRSYR